MSIGQGPIVIDVSAADTAQAIAANITADIKPVLILLGQYDKSLSAHVRSVYIRALLPIASDAGSIIMDDGAAAGCAGDLGASALEAEELPVTVGVTGAGADSDPNHAFVVKVPTSGADALQWTFHLASALAKCDDPAHKSVVLTVVGGGDREKNAIVRAARKSWPIVLVTGAGGVSDTIATALLPQADGTPALTPADPVLREIVETGAIYTFKIDEDVDDLKRILSAQLQKSIDGLTTAWQWYEDLDKAAVDRQKTFRGGQNLLLFLGIAATLLAIMSKATLPAWMNKYPKIFGGLIQFAHAHKDAYHWTLNIVLIVVPVVVSFLTARNNRFRAGNKWILLRAAAESIKREIFQFRARAGCIQRQPVRADFAQLQACSQSERHYPGAGAKRGEQEQHSAPAAGDS